MKRTKKIISLLLAVVMLLGVTSISPSCCPRFGGVMERLRSPLHAVQGVTTVWGSAATVPTAAASKIAKAVFMSADAAFYDL